MNNAYVSKIDKKNASIQSHENQRIVLIVHSYVWHRRLPSAAVSFLVCRVKYCLFNKFLMMHDISPTEYDSHVELQQQQRSHFLHVILNLTFLDNNYFNSFSSNFTISHLQAFHSNFSFKL